MTGIIGWGELVKNKPKKLKEDNYLFWGLKIIKKKRRQLRRLINGDLKISSGKIMV